MLTVYPLIWSPDVAALSDWAVKTLGLRELWRNAKEDGSVDHAELEWHGGRVSLNELRDGAESSGPSGIALCLDEVVQVDAVHERAVAAGAKIVQGPEKSRVAYSFTAVDPDGNQWWVNAETGFLDQLRNAGRS